LEAQLRKAQNSQSQLSFEMEKLKKDNVELYGKIRYMSSYSNHRNTGETGVVMLGGYRDMYEEEMDPFKRFHQKVSVL
jgi:hypothetical protein